MSRSRIDVPESAAAKLRGLVDAETRARKLADEAREGLVFELRSASEAGYSVRALAEVVDLSPALVHRLIRGES